MYKQWGVGLMVTVEEIKKLRFRYLNVLYDFTNGDENLTVEEEKIHAGLGIDEELFRTIEDYLSREDLIRFVSINYDNWKDTMKNNPSLAKQALTEFGGGSITDEEGNISTTFVRGIGNATEEEIRVYDSVSIYNHRGLTHAGLKEFEQAYDKPELPTEHFPASIYNITIRNMVNSQIQQASPNSTQTLAITENNRKELEDIIKALKKILDTQTLNSERKAELSAEVKTIESQMNSPKPKAAIIREGLLSAKSILNTNSGNPPVDALISQITTQLSTLK